MINKLPRLSHQGENFHFPDLGAQFPGQYPCYSLASFLSFSPSHCQLSGHSLGRFWFVDVNWEFSQFSMSSTASSLSVHGTLPRQNKSTLGPEKPSFKFFESFLLSELVCTYDKLNIYAKNISCHRLIKIIIYGTEKDREKGNKSYLKKLTSG